MAQLVETPKKILKMFERGTGDDFMASLQREEAAFQELENTSNTLPPGEVKGALISFPWADGHAHYLVLSEKPLKLCHIPYADAWHVDPATIRGLRLEDVQQKISRHQGMFKIFAKKKSP